MVSILLPSASPPYIARLQTLRDRERAWKTLTWKGRYNLQLPPTGSVYEFVGGFYGNGKEDDRRITASISFLELPDADSTRLENGQPDLKMWTHPMQDVTIIDFTMDPSQDLLVLIALATSGWDFLFKNVSETIIKLRLAVLVMFTNSIYALYRQTSPIPKHLCRSFRVCSSLHTHIKPLNT